PDSREEAGDHESAGDPRGMRGTCPHEVGEPAHAASAGSWMRAITPRGEFGMSESDAFPPNSASSRARVLESPTPLPELPVNPAPVSATSTSRRPSPPDARI